MLVRSHRLYAVALFVLVVLAGSGCGSTQREENRIADLKSNRLISETSPYLLQHAHNPVDWFPWGEEALARAMSEDKPIFLSVGYSSCHWCHVMAHESFENDSIAAIMNEHFINIKVDREERPDIDDLYMTYVQMTTGSGGWPMSVFLTPQGKPFFGGTYFPPVDAYGRRGFPTVLRAVAEAWRRDRQRIEESANSAINYLGQHLNAPSLSTLLTIDDLQRAVDDVLNRFDPVNGGFGGAPKFPPELFAVTTDERVSPDGRQEGG